MVELIDGASGSVKFKAHKPYKKPIRPLASHYYKGIFLARQGVESSPHLPVDLTREELCLSHLSAVIAEAHLLQKMDRLVMAHLRRAATSHGAAASERNIDRRDSHSALF